MEQSWHPETVTVSRKRMELAAVKEYLDEHYTEKLTLDDLAEKFFINKFYLSKIFKEAYGTTVNNYLISKRITRGSGKGLHCKGCALERRRVRLQAGLCAEPRP